MYKNVKDPKEKKKASMVNSIFLHLNAELKLKLIIHSKYFFVYDWLKSDRMWDLLQIAMIPVRGGKV